MEGEEGDEPFELSIQSLIQEVQAVDWSDIEATPQAQIPENPVFTTEPAGQYLRYYQLFRAVLNNQEVTQRSYLLTKLLLRIRSTNYYALMLRSQYFFETCDNPAQIEQELLFVNCLLNSNAKEYQLWTYKKQIFKKYQNLLSENLMFYHTETQFLDYLLDSDGKNYHVWDYKLWLTQHYHKEAEELQSTAKILFKGRMSIQQLQQQFAGTQMNVQEIDWRNCYSVWSYRYNLRKAVSSSKNQQDLIQFEIGQFQIMRNWFSTQSNHTNQCGWNYMIGLIIESQVSSEELVNEFLLLSISIFQTTKNRHAGNAIVQLSDELLSRYGVKTDKRREVIEELIACDPVRRQYYEHLLQEM